MHKTLQRGVLLCGILLLRGSSYAIFNDIEEHPYRESIIYLQMHNVVKGYPDGGFGPERPVTRAEMLKIVFAGMYDEEHLGTGSNCFVDVLQQRYAPYVCYAKAEGIVKGYQGNLFKPETSVTVGEGLKIALKSFGYTISEGTGHDRYQPYIDFVHEHNIFSKYALFPNRPMTRGQMSYLVHQLLVVHDQESQLETGRDARSPGCFTTLQSENPPTSIIVDGQERHFITTIGKQYRQDTPSKLIFAFHGRTNSNQQLRNYIKLEKNRDDASIVVYPSGLPESGPTRNRKNPGESPEDMRGVRLFDALVEEFSNDYCIDMDEIYVVGHSLGAWFTNTLGCVRGDIIRGIGSVGGSISHASCSGPVAAMIMHNPQDRLAGFGGGIAARDQLLTANGCTGATRSLDQGLDNCIEYTDCIEDAPVVRCPHREDNAWRDGSYYPHTRPSFAMPMIRGFWNQ